MKKLFGIFVLGIFLFSFAFAHGVYENEDFRYKERYVETGFDDSDISWRFERYGYYDNDERYSTRDYRHRYSYRMEKDYWDRHYWEVDEPRKYVRNAVRTVRVFDGSSYSDYGVKDYYYKYNEPMRKLERHDCWVHPPKDQIFYVECP